MATESTWAIVAGTPGALGSGERAVVADGADDGADNAGDDDADADDPVPAPASTPGEGVTEAGVLTAAESGTRAGEVAMAGATEVVAGPTAGGAEHAASSRAVAVTTAWMGGRRFDRAIPQCAGPNPAAVVAGDPDA